jgi:NDP-sugar pyrophosphorylase family protein
MFNVENDACTIIITMAGNGTRFANCGYDTIKPLIQVNGKSILEWTLSSLPEEKLQENFLTFAIRTEHEEKYQIKKFIESKYKYTDFKMFDELTRGNLETAYIATNSLQYSNKPVLFLDSDNYFCGDDIFNFIEQCKKEREYFCVVCHFDQIDKSNKWSFIRKGINNRVKLIKEKPETITYNMKPLIGAFYFSSVAMFRQLANKILTKENPEKGEYYMSRVIQSYIDNEIPVFGYDCENVVPLGTPEDLEKFKRKV